MKVAKYVNAYVTITKGMTTTTTTSSKQLTLSPRLGTWVVPMEQQTHRNGAFLTAHHLRSQYLIVRRAAPERAARPPAPTGATSTTLGLPTHTPCLSHQIFQCLTKLHGVRRGTRGRGSQQPNEGSHDALHNDNGIF